MDITGNLQQFQLNSRDANMQQLSIKRKKPLLAKDINIFYWLYFLLQGLISQ